MTTIPFSPSNSSPPFQSVFTLDGAQYTGQCTWNIAGQRWYFTLIDQNGDITWNGPLIGSPEGYDIYLAPGIFKTSTILYRSGTGNFEITP